MIKPNTLGEQQLRTNATADPENALRGIVIGLGHQGLDHVRAIDAFPGAVLVGVADPDVEAHAKIAGSCQLANIPVCKDAASLLSELAKPPDFAVVAAPPNVCLPIARYLVSREIPFLKEKPFARNVAEAHELLAIPDIDQYCCTAIQRRYGQLEYDIRDYLDRAPTTPRSFTYTYTLGLARPAPGWRSDVSQAGGGALLDMGYHVMARVQGWFGPPDTVQSGFGANGSIARANDAEEQIILVLSYKSGLRGLITMSPVSPEKQETFLISWGEEIIEGCGGNALVRTNLDIPLAHLGLPQEDLLGKQLASFLARVRSGEGFAEDQARHLAIMGIIDQCYRSRLVPRQGQLVASPS